MSKKQVMNAKIKPILLNGKQIKERIENTILVKENKYSDTKVLFENKDNIFSKLPYSDFKISIAQEIEEDKLLIKQLYEPEYELIEETVVVEEPATEEVKEETEFSIIDEIYEYEDEGKKVKDRYRSKVKKVDTDAIVARIKAEGKEKNKGKKVITFRDINKELRPYMIKKMKGVEAIDNDAMTSIDIYLNAVNKIDVVDDLPDSNKPDLGDILNDLDK